MSQGALRHAGFSLVELLVAMTLGIILTFGVIEVYTNSKQTYRTQEELSRLQENARYAMDILSRDLRMVGYIGCPNLTNVTPNEVGTAFNYTSTGVLQGNQSTGSDGDNVSGTLPTGLSNSDRVPHTDVLLVQGAGRCATPLTANMASTTGDIAIAAANRCEFAQSDIALVSNCEAADIFTITNDPGSTGNLSHAALSRAYPSTAEVMTFSSNTYFIGTDTSGLPALFVIDNTAAAPAAIALVEGVENMQVQYGVDTNADDTPDSYVDANNVGDWSQVLVVRITLLMRTINEMGAQAFAFNVGGTNTTYAAGPLRQQFVTTVKLRNRSL